MEMTHASLDHEERIQDFFARHAGAGAQPMRQGQSEGGLKGWSEVYAGDGYALRCDWSTVGTLEEMKYSEIPPSNLRS